MATRRTALAEWTPATLADRLGDDKMLRMVFMHANGTFAYYHDDRPFAKRADVRFGCGGRRGDYRYRVDFAIYSCELFAIPTSLHYRTTPPPHLIAARPGGLA